MIRIVEGVQLYLKWIKEQIAEMAAAAVETSHAVARISQVLPEVLHTVRDIHSEQQRMNEQLNRFISDQAKQEGRVARLDKHVSEVRQKLGLGA